MRAAARCLLVLAVVLSAHVSFAAEEKSAEELNKADWKKLQGAWVVSAAEAGGQELPKELLAAIVLTIDEEKYTVEGIPEGTQKGELKIDASKDVKEMTIEPTEGPNKDKPAKSIYKFDEEKLVVCYDLQGAEFPKEFKTTPENRLLTITYERKKDEAKK